MSKRKRLAADQANRESASLSNCHHSSTKPYRSNKYRDAVDTIRDLLDWREWWEWQLPPVDDECETPAQAESTRRYILAEIADLSSEIDRRARYRNHPDAPPWPAAGIDLRPFWDAVKQRVSVTDFFEVASLGILHRSGNGYRSACPLCHSTNKEVFSIYDDCRRWHCFRCHEGGDVFALASHIWKDKNFPEVAYSLGDMFGIARPTATVSGTSNPPAHKHVVNAGSVRLVTVKVGG